MLLGVDLMGGETLPEALFPGILQALGQTDPSLHIAIFLDQSSASIIEPQIPSTLHPRLKIITTQEFISLDDEPLIAVRKKKNSSLVQGIVHLHRGEIDAFITVGNTGALIAAATLTLSRLKGVHRPPLLALLPTETSAVAVLDVGGNIQCKARHLVEFAHLGAAYVKTMLQCPLPKVGLLNIGSESIKGTSEVKEAYNILAEYCRTELHPDFAFEGNIEPSDVFQGKVDVLITNGFVGNIFLKSSESMAAFICNHLKKISGDMLQRELQDHFNYEEYPGALVCGLDRVVVKCHSYSSPRALSSGILSAARYLECNLLGNFTCHKKT